MALILIVEDDVVLRALFTRAIGRLPDTELVVAGTMSATRDVLAVYTPDLIIADINLPDGTIFDAFGTEGPPAPVIFVTGYARQYELLLPDSPDVMMLEKPVSVTELRDTVSTRLGVTYEPASCYASGPFTPSDYIHFCFAAMRSVTISFFEEDGEPAGRAMVVEGVAWCAYDDIGEGMPALRRLLYEPGLRFTLSEVPDPPPERTIHLPSHAVVRDLALFGRRVENLARAEQTLTGMLVRGDGASDSHHGTGRKKPPTPVFGTHIDRSRHDMETPINQVDVSSSFNGMDLDGIDLDAPTPPSEPVVPEPVKEPELTEEELRFQRLKDEGLEAMLMRDYDAALAAFEAADRLIPGDPAVLQNIDRLKYKRGER